MRPRRRGLESPLDVHSLGDAGYVSVAYRRRVLDHLHVRSPPRRPVEHTKRSICGHLDNAAAIGAAAVEADVTVVGKMRRPPLDIPRKRKDPANWRTHYEFIQYAHRYVGRHCAELYECCHDSRSTGTQLVVILNPSR